MVHRLSMPAKTIDVQLLNPFITATLDCLEKMVRVNAQRQRVFIKTDPQMHGYVTGIIGMTNGITGSVAVSFPLDLAKEIVSRCLGEPVAGLSNDMVADGIGEVANMVAGGAKRIFASTKYRFDISTPTMIIGFPACLYNPVDTVSIACEFSAGDASNELFIIEIALKPTSLN